MNVTGPRQGFVAGASSRNDLRGNCDWKPQSRAILINRRAAISLLAATAMMRRGVASEASPPITSLAYSPDGLTVLAGSQGGVSIRDQKTLQQTDQFSPAMDNIHDLRFNHDGSVLAVAGGNPGEQGIVELIDWPKRTLKQRVRCHDDVIDSVDFSPDGSRLVAASADQVCSVFESSRQKPIARFTQHSKAVRSVRFLPDGELIVSASRDETLRVWEATSGKPVRTLHNHSRDVHALSLRPGGGDPLPMIASASADLTIRFWQPTIGRMVRFARLNGEPMCIGWTNDGGKLIAGCRDGVVRVIDPTSVQVTKEKPVTSTWLYAVAVDPASADRVVVGGADGKVRKLRV